MDNKKYNHLHNLPKKLTEECFSCAPFGKQIALDSYAILNPKDKFRVIQNRRGYRRKNNLSYILFYNKTDIMIRIDIHGQRHLGVQTPHVHIFNEKYHNGRKAIPLSELPDYDQTDDIIQSLIEFLKYNHIETNGLVISKPIDLLP